MRFLTVLIIAVVLLGCKKKEPPKPPESAQLVFPEKNSECTTGEEINETTTQVEFRWQASNHTETYELIVTNLDNGNKQDFNGLTAVAKTVPVEKGTPYSWVVISKSSVVPETASSATWNFFNSGFETSYVPFPAEIIHPKMGANITKDLNNEVELSWVGADVDNDIQGFEIYLSTENPPENLIFSPGENATSRKVTVEVNTIYFWKVITKDKEGNSSDSGVFEFKVN